MSVSLEAIFQAVGGIVTVGAIATGIVGLIGVFFKKVIENWIDNRFHQQKQQFEHELDQRKKEFEHAQTKELQNLKAKIDTVIQGSLKLQEREFKIIPEALEKLNAGFSSAGRCCAPVRRNTQIEHLTNIELTDLAEKHDVSTTQIKQLLAASGAQRQQIWTDIEDWKQFADAWNAMLDANHFILVNGVFIPESVGNHFTTVVHIVFEILSMYRTGFESSPKNHRLMIQAWEKFEKDAKLAFAQAGKAVRMRLLEQTHLAQEELKA